MLETGAIPIGFNDSPWRRAEPVFLQPRRFPEYLRLQNIRDRGVDLAELSPRARAVGDGAAADPSDPTAPRLDQTLARIGEVRPVKPGGSGEAPQASACACPPATTQSIDGLGRMIDVMA